MRTLLDRNQNTSSTALRVLTVMEWLGKLQRPVTVAEVCTASGLDRPTANRALLTLVESGFAARDMATKKFRLSYKIVSVARSVLAGSQDVEAVRSALRKVSEVTGETCHYSVLEGFESITTLREKGSQIVAVEFLIGDREELHCTSIGKAILAHQSAAFLDQFLSRPLSRRTPRTISEPDALRSELARIRQTGLAIDDREMLFDMRCVAAPVFDAGGEVTSGISISGPTSRFTDEHLAYLGSVLARYAREISTAIGYVAPDE